MSAVEDKQVPEGANTTTDAAAASSHKAKPTNGESKNGRREDNREGKENQPIMVARNKSGTVKWFSFKNGYGFITVDDDGDDIFVHRSEFIREGAREVFYHVDVGDKLEFDIINRAKGREAVAVTGPNGMRIPGSPAGFNRRRNANSERRNNRNEDQYDDAVEHLQGEVENLDLANGKRAGGRGGGGRRRNASGEGQENQAPEGNGEHKGEKRERRRPRRNTGGRGPRGPRTEGDDSHTEQQHQAENVAPAE